MKQFDVAFGLLLLFIQISGCDSQKSMDNATDKPNFLWITCEDISVMQGSYGDEIALTPNLDRFAAEGIQYNNAYSTAPVCSPARSCLVTGVYATSLGTQNLRSEFKIPSEIKTLPHILRENGYYCSNNYKEDYNFTDTTIWDESSNTAHWRNRNKNQSFYSVFNLETTHQSQIFGDDESFYNKYGNQLTADQRHDPNKIILAPYFFDSPEVRKLWARYYDLVTIMDQQVAEILDQLEEDGLTDNTIVFYFSDHGTGMPRSKRALYNSGVHVPFITHIPEKYNELLKQTKGSQNDNIISFVDFPPTILSIAAIPIPEYMQGNPFLGNAKSAPSKYAYATSDRVDEAFELSRTVKSEKFSYIRNFLPHTPLIQPNYYSDQSEIMKELYQLKKLTPYEAMNVAQKSMWHPRRPAEELYDLEIDPYEINNLAADNSYQNELLNMRNALKRWMMETHDTGLLSEGYLLDHTSMETAYTVAQNPEVYPLSEILELNDLILDEIIDQQKLTSYLSNTHELIRYWAAVSLQYVENPNQSTLEKLRKTLSDNSQLVKLAASETMCSYSMCSLEAQQNILDGLNSENEAEMLYAARIYELNNDKAPDIRADAMKFYQGICEQSKGKWKGYDLYACWALTEVFKSKVE